MQEQLLPVTEWRAIEDVRPYAGNPRNIPQTAVSKVAKSIEAFGWRQAIVVDEDGVIIAGHTRRLAAISLGLSRVPVHVAAGLTPEQAKAYRLADNRTHDEASWNRDVLALELQSLGDLGFNLSGLGFDPVEIGSQVPEFAPIGADEIKPLDRKKEVECPSCGHRFSS